MPAQAPEELKCESGDRRPVGMGPLLGFWLTTGSGDPGEHAGLLIPTPVTAQLLQWGPSDPVTMTTSLQLE